LRVALLTREYLPETQWGGIGAFYADFAQGLRSRGHEVEVFTQGLAEAGRIESEGVLVHRCMPRWYGFGPRRKGALAGMRDRHLGLFAVLLAREVALRFRARHRERPFDLVESHEHLGIGADLARGQGAASPPHVVRYHTAYTVFVDEAVEPWPRSRWIERLEGRVIRSADLRITPSGFVDRMARRHFPDAPVADLALPLACRFDTAPDSVLEKKEHVIAFAGRLVDRKQPMRVARLFASLADRFPEWRLELAGADSPLPDGTSTWEACLRILDRHRDRVLYHGALDSDAVRDLFARASLLIVPSTLESFGLVALEAMSQGCVPVVSGGSALEEVVADAGVVFDLADNEGLEAKVAALLEDEVARLLLARSALARVRSHYDRDFLLARNLEAFEGLVAGSPLERFAP
jgi:glycosyltransferase involved in cell wall biosynthesis